MYNNSSYLSYLNFLSEAAGDNKEQEIGKSLNNFMTKAKEWVSDRIKSLKELLKVIKEKVHTKVEGYVNKLKGVQVKMPNSFGDLLSKFSKKSEDLESEKTSEESEDKLEIILSEVKEEIAKNPEKKGFRLFKLDNILAGVSNLLKNVISSVSEMLSFLSSSLSKLKNNPRETFSEIRSKFSEMKNKLVSKNRHIKFSFRIFGVTRK